MKPKIQFTIIILLIINFYGVTFSGQDYTTLSPVSENDNHWSALQAEINKITKSDPNSPIGFKIRQYGSIKTQDANSLFPGWKFYSINFVDYAKNPSDENKFHLVGGLGLWTSIAVLSDANSVKTLQIYNCVDYEKFLKINKISINDINDAILVWNSWCEIHRQSGKNLKVEKVSDNEWKLGINSDEQTISSDNEFRTVVKRTSFYKITTDPNTYQVTKCKDEIETSDKRQERIKKD